jgi:hypothetical protein
MWLYSRECLINCYSKYIEVIRYAQQKHFYCYQRFSGTERHVSANLTVFRHCALCTKEILGSKLLTCRQVHPVSDNYEKIFVVTADDFNTLHILLQQEVYSKGRLYSYVTVGDATASDFVLQNELLEVVSSYCWR